MRQLYMFEILRELWRVASGRTAIHHPGFAAFASARLRTSREIRTWAGQQTTFGVPGVAAIAHLIGQVFFVAAHGGRSELLAPAAAKKLRGGLTGTGALVWLAEKGLPVPPWASS
jgi:hypothetical protein